MKLLIVGVGLIGGSFSLSLQRKKEIEVGGVDSDSNVLDVAVERSIISKRFPDVKSGMKWADIVLLTVPVNVLKELLPTLLDDVADHQTIVDFGSTKSAICKSVNGHPNRHRFIAAHPIAGTEHSGPGAAFAELYDQKNLIVCDSEYTDADAMSEFEQLALDAGFYLTKMPSEEHDKHLAYISHLSHVSSYVLSNTVLEKEKDGEIILDLAGSGFASTVRLAKSSPEMWSAIFLENKEMVLESISAYQEELDRLKQLIEHEKHDDIGQYLQEGRKIRKILK